MPKSLHGKKLTSHEHETWKSVYRNASGARDPGAVATAAVLKHRRKKKIGFTKK